MFIWMVLIGTVVTLIVIYLVNQAKNDSSPPTNPTTRTYSTSAPPPRVSTTVVRTPQLGIYQSYLKHFPIIQAAVRKALTSQNYYRHVTQEEADAEITYFMFFLAVTLSDDVQKIRDSEDFILFVNERYNCEDMMDRVDVYEKIISGEGLPRVDWGKPVSKYALMHNDQTLKRAYCAFGDFLINPYCRYNYFDAPAFNGEMWLDSVGFDRYIETDIFEKIADFTQCFPNYLKY